MIVPLRLITLTFELVQAGPVMLPKDRFREERVATYNGHYAVANYRLTVPRIPRRLLQFRRPQPRRNASPPLELWFARINKNDSTA